MDPTKSHAIKTAPRGIEKLSLHDFDYRLPITLEVLSLLLAANEDRTYDLYDRKLFSTMMALAYYACLRSGELFPSYSANHALLAVNLVRLGTGYSIYFPSYKHSTQRPTPMILLPCSSQAVCPVELLDRYVSVRPATATLAFTNVLGLPVARSKFKKILDACCVRAGLVPKNYNLHSFRIGRATQMFKDNKQVSEIMRVGRWNSMAFMKYLRPDHIRLS